ncbi:MAG: homoserine dehydrogenase [Oscillospiraceae bacterium]|nr:homoserine dehydrogenase [Oscillospiraceae bacterium]
MKVAVLGFGVVGSGTVEVLDKNSDKISNNAGQDIQVKRILDIREFPNSIYKDLFAKDFEEIINDNEISLVVETIGGIGIAYEYTRRCLESGKSVVTSNKELVATHGYELLKLAEEKGVSYLFEASVGGGIPIIRPMTQCVAANQITEIYGILNGTTNYILTEMGKNGVDFSLALEDAQKKGYAEADPTADIDGHDACRKICILSSLAFGRQVNWESVPTEGISTVTINDLRFADDLGCKIKLLVRARIVGDKISVYVAPHLVSHENLLSGIDGVMNGVVIRGNMVGDLLFYGAGAGKMPTASAIVADIIDVAKHENSPKQHKWEKGDTGNMTDSTQLESAWYIRTDADRRTIANEFGEVIFAQELGSQTAFKTVNMSGRKVRDILGRGIPALSLFRVLGDY